MSTSGAARRLPMEELFRDGLEPIGDETMRRRLDANARRDLERGYADAVSEEMLQLPEAV